MSRIDAMRGNQSSADSPGRHAHQIRRQADQHIVGQQEQPAHQNADHDQVRARAGQVGFQQGATHGAQVAAAANDWPRRKARCGHRHQRAEADQRQQPADGPQPRLADRPLPQQDRRQHAAGYRQKVRAQPHAFQQHAGDRGPRASADVVSFGPRRIDQPGGRVGRIVRHQRQHDERRERREHDREQVALMIAILEHGVDCLASRPARPHRGARPSTGRVHARKES